MSIEIIKTEIISERTDDSLNVEKTFLGEMFLGSGAMGLESRELTEFLIYYSDGSTETEEVEHDTYRYEELWEYLEFKE